MNALAETTTTLERLVQDYDSGVPLSASIPFARAAAAIGRAELNKQERAQAEHMRQFDARYREALQSTRRAF